MEPSGALTLSVSGLRYITYYLMASAARGGAGGSGDDGAIMTVGRSWEDSLARSCQSSGERWL